MLNEKFTKLDKKNQQLKV